MNKIIFTKISHDKVKTEVVNIMDISLFKLNDKKNVEVVFTVSIFLIYNF